MENNRQLPNGTNVISMSQNEFLAIVDYALAGQENYYPVDLLGLSEKKIDAVAIDGYNELIDDGVITIDDEGYPESNDSNPDATLMISALSTASIILTIKLSLDRRRMTFYLVHGDDCWLLLWRSKNDYRAIVETDNLNPARTFLNNVSNVISKRKQNRVTFTFTFADSSGRTIADTTLISDNDGYFHEKLPKGPLILFNNDEWPKIYDYSEFIIRMGELLKAA